MLIKVVCPGQGIDPPVGKKLIEKEFELKPSSVDQSAMANIPKFHFIGRFDSVNCCYTEPFDGIIICKESEFDIKSVEV
jgi:hypothetical protein